MKFKAKTFLITLAVVLGMRDFYFPASDNFTEYQASLNDSVESKTPLTPKGNLTKVDDVHQVSDEDTIEDKQFITVQSKNGNTFYIIIDRSGDTENVYFLNAVDEADLMALMEDEQASQTASATCNCTTKCEVGNVNADCLVCSKNKDKCASTSTATPTPAPSESETVPQKQKNSANSVVILLLLALLGAGGAFYWFKVKNKKSSTKGTTDPNDFYEEDEDYETEDEETETETDAEQDYEADESDDDISEISDEESEDLKE